MSIEKMSSSATLEAAASSGRRRARTCWEPVTRPSNVIRNSSSNNSCSRMKPSHNTDSTTPAPSSGYIFPSPALATVSELRSGISLVAEREFDAREKRFMGRAESESLLQKFSEEMQRVISSGQTPTQINEKQYDFSEKFCESNEDVTLDDDFLKEFLKNATKEQLDEIKGIYISKRWQQDRSGTKLKRGRNKVESTTYLRSTVHEQEKKPGHAGGSPIVAARFLRKR
eukprot:g5349.t1